MDRVFILKEVFYKKESMFYLRLIPFLPIVASFLLFTTPLSLFSDVSQLSSSMSVPISKCKSRLQRVVDEFRKSKNLPAISVAIASSLDEIVLINSGEIDKRVRTDVTSHTYFKMGSITTSFTASILAKLVQDGRVSLNDPVSKYLSHSINLPTYKEEGIVHPITLLHLATHTSGLPNLPNQDLTQKNFSRKQLYMVLEKVSLDQKPGSIAKISNVGYALLAEVLTSITKKSIEDLYQIILLNPLQIDDLIFSLTKKDQRRFATGHLNKGPLSLSEFMKKPKCLVAADGAFSTSNEMVKWLKFHVNGNTDQLKGVVPLLHTSYFQGKDGLERTLCFEKNAFKKESLLEIDDSFFGFSSYLGVTTTSKVGIAIFSNSSSACLKELSDKLREVLYQ